MPSQIVSKKKAAPKSKKGPALGVKKVVKKKTYQVTTVKINCSCPVPPGVVKSADLSPKQIKAIKTSTHFTNRFQIFKERTNQASFDANTYYTRHYISQQLNSKSGNKAADVYNSKHLGGKGQRELPIDMGAYSYENNKFKSDRRIDIVRPSKKTPSVTKGYEIKHYTRNVPLSTVGEQSILQEVRKDKALVISKGYKITWVFTGAGGPTKPLRELLEKEPGKIKIKQIKLAI